MFGLGAILCEILTGHPPYTGSDISDILAKARTCELAEALSRLASLWGGLQLLALVKACLAAEPADRPQNAGTVAKEVKAYLAGVQERLQAAERERAAAQARAEEAKKTVAAERRAQAADDVGGSGSAAAGRRCRQLGRGGSSGSKPWRIKRC